MSVIIRLQNLPWSANALDIRQHFQGLSIPEGGVHIVGGEQGDAFIAFSTDEDARQAMMTDGGKIKEVKLKLMLSSRTEMQKVIEQARQQSVSLQNLLQMPAPPITPIVPVIAPVLVPPPAPEPPKLPERRDSDTLSNSSKDKDRRGDRKERSRSRDRDRNRRDNNRRRRSHSRDRNRRRRSRERSRERSKERERSRDRDRKRPARDQGDSRRVSRDRNEPRRDFRRDGSKDDSKNNDQNGSVPNKPALLANPTSGTPVWAVPPGLAETKPMGFGKAPLIPSRSTTVPVPAEVSLGRGDMDGRRIMGSGPFPTGTMRPIPSADVEPAGPFHGSRDSWQGQGRPPGELGGRFPPMDRPSGFVSSTEPVRPQGFGNEGNDFDGRSDFLPRGSSFRGVGGGGNFRGSLDTRLTFPPGRLGTGTGNILGPPGTMHRPMGFPRGPPPPSDSFPRSDRFDPVQNRPFVGDRFSRETGNRSYDPRPQSAGCCVEVRNISLDASYSDLRKFFTGIYVANNAIKIINDNKGHRVGIAYMRFANLDAKERAIQLTGKQIRGSVVEIMHLEDDIFDKAIDSFRPDMHVDSPEMSEPHVIDKSCLHVQDLPTYAKESDIYKLFPKFAIAEIILTHKEERTYSAYIKFVRPEDAKNALYSSTKHMIGSASVKVLLCGLDKFQLAKSRLTLKEPKDIGSRLTSKESKDIGSNGSPSKDPRSRHEIEPVPKIISGIISDCILLKGLPYQTTDRDLLDFFSDVALVPLRIHIMLDNFNKPSGDAYCEFSSYEETMQAITKNNTMLGKQEVTVKPVLRAEMLEALGLPMQPELGPPKHMMPRLPFNRSFGRPMGILGNGPRMPMMGRPMGPGMMMGHGPMGHPPPDAPIEGFGKPGCVVSLENVPFRAEIDEILDIFSDFDVTRESVIRRFNDVGMPTGDARVSFPSPSEAQRAARELRGVQIRGRPIFLNLL